MIRIGTRGSELALWQANHIAGLIGSPTEIAVIKTKGDHIRNVSFQKMEGKGFFTKEIEEALRSGMIDIAIHSMKDLPTEETDGLMVAAITAREDPSDVLIIRKGAYDPGRTIPLAPDAVVGTSSLRRTAQIRNLISSVTVRPLRGNVTTRVRRLLDKRFDAIILAAAGLKRLNIDLERLEAFTLPFDLFLPAPAQGALAVQIRKGDARLAEAVAHLNHWNTERAVTAERRFLKQFGGGCHVPLGALAECAGESIRLSAVVASVDGAHCIRETLTANEPNRLGEEMAEVMKTRGAMDLI